MKLRFDRFRTVCFILAGFIPLTPLDAAAQTAKTAAQKPGALRLACDGPSEGAIVTINGEEKGPCPMNILVAPGPIRVHAQKEDGDIAVRVFDQAFTLQPGEPRRVDIELSGPKLTEKGLELKRAEDEAKRLAAQKEAERVQLAAARERNKELVRRVMRELKTADFSELRAAELADPEGVDVFDVHTVLAAVNVNMPELIDTLERGYKSGAITTTQVAHLPKLPALLEDPAFVDVVTRFAGEDGLAKVREGASVEGRLAWFNQVIGSAKHNYLEADDCNDEGVCFTYMRREIAGTETKSYDDYPPACATMFHMGNVIGANDATAKNTEQLFFWGGLASHKIAPMTATRSGPVVQLNPTRTWPVRNIATPSEYHALLEADLLQTVTAACTKAVAAMPKAPAKKR